VHGRPPPFGAALVVPLLALRRLSRALRRIGADYRSARGIGCGRLEALRVALEPGELARERSRRAWRSWDRDEIERECRPWNR
jgi:hypothetical protein